LQLRQTTQAGGGKNIFAWLTRVHSSQSHLHQTSLPLPRPLYTPRRRRDAAARHGPTAAAARDGPTAAGWPCRAAVLERHAAAHGPAESAAAAAAAVRPATPAAVPGAAPAPAADVEPGAPVPPGLLRPGAAAAPAGRVLRGSFDGAGAPRWAQRGQDALDRGPAVLDGRELRLQLLLVHRRGTFLWILAHLPWNLRVRLFRSDLVDGVSFRCELVAQIVNKCSILNVVVNCAKESLGLDVVGH
jgi:hypothetical protein